MAAGDRRQTDRRQAASPVQVERRNDDDRRGRRKSDRAGVAGGLELRRRRLRVQVLDARRAIEASRDALKKKKP